MNKIFDTRNEILVHALHLVSERGLLGLTIGALAKSVGMSKSGVYAHFDSKEDLQCQVLNAAAFLFADAVVLPAIAQSRGLPRIEKLFELWLDWETEQLMGGCPFVAAATEFDDRAGIVRDALVTHHENLTETLIRAVNISVQVGHLHTDLDAQQFVFELWAIVLSYHQFSRLMHQKSARDHANHAFQRLINNAQWDMHRPEQT